MQSKSVSKLSVIAALLTMVYGFSIKVASPADNWKIVIRDDMCVIRIACPEI
jgi:hypothetical protein